MSQYTWEFSFKKLEKSLSRLSEILQDINHNPPSYIMEATIQSFDVVIEL